MTRSIPDLTPTARANLEARSSEVCVVFTDHRLPPGAAAVTARVGLGPAGLGRAVYVTRRITYAGDGPRVAEWLREGTLYFADFASAVDWLTTVIPRLQREFPGSRTDGDRRCGLPDELRTSLKSEDRNSIAPQSRSLIFASS